MEMKSLIPFLVLLAFPALCKVRASSINPLSQNKIFNYENELPIADEPSGFSSGKNSSVLTPTPSNFEAAQAACWSLIKDESGE